MRRAGTIPDQRQARQFADFLLTLGIEARVDANADDWAVWIIDEKHLEQGREELEQFLQNPDDLRYDGAGHTAESIRKETAQKHRQAKKNIIEVRNRWQRPLAKRAPVTFALMAVSIVVFVLTEYVDKSGRIYVSLLISSHVWQDQLSAPAFGLVEVHSGQVWRLVTPIILHANLLHIAFNMWMLHFFGTQIESRTKPWKTALLILAIALPSNLAQYSMAGPLFVGISGVVYGLFGYVWTKSRTDPWCGYVLHRSTVVILIGWLLLCMSPWSMIEAANAAHVVGLAAGAVVGLAPFLWRKLSPPGK